MKRILATTFAFACAAAAASAAPEDHGRERYRRTIEKLSQAHGVPETLIHRVIMRESKYAPHLTNHGHYGLMQIKLETAKGMGYGGGAKGLLDGETNLTYAIPYLANAWLAADHDENRAVQLYAGGYYYVAKRKGLIGKLRTAKSEPLRDTTLVAYAEQQQPEPQQAASNPFAALFGGGTPTQAQQMPQQQMAAVDGEVVEDWAIEGEELVVFERAPLPPKRPRKL